MKTLLRSCFVADKGDRKELLLRNFLLLQKSGLGFEDVEDQTIWNFIVEFVRASNHVPDIKTIRATFTHRGNQEVLDRLDTLVKEPARDEGDFKTYLNLKADERRTRKTTELLKDAAAILRQGMEFQEKGRREKTFLQGPQDAIKFILNNSHAIITPTLGSKLSGEVLGDGADFRAEYERVESDPTAGVGQWSGLAQMDMVLNGAKRNELWLHAAFTGHLKSTLAVNWAYNQAVYERCSTAFFSLEMPYQQVRRQLFAIHSSHPKFREIRHQMGLQGDLQTTIGLPYEHIRDGTLAAYHPRAREFLFDYVIKDLDDPSNKYGKIHIEVHDPDRADFTVADLRQRAELIFSKDPFTLLILDHALLMSPRKWVPSTTERLNEILRDLKRLAMAFNRGTGMALLVLFQLSRDGFRMALKRKEKTGQALYDLTALSYANEAERSADVVTTSWVDDELRKQSRAQFQCLKARDNALFETFVARVEWHCRRLLTCRDMDFDNQNNESNGDIIDQLASLE